MDLECHQLRLARPEVIVMQPADTAAEFLQIAGMAWYREAVHDLHPAAVDRPPGSRQDVIFAAVRQLAWRHHPPVGSAGVRREHVPGLVEPDEYQPVAHVGWRRDAGKARGQSQAEG